MAYEFKPLCVYRAADYVCIALTALPPRPRRLLSSSVVVDFILGADIAHQDDHDENDPKPNSHRSLHFSNSISNINAGTSAKMPPNLQGDPKLL